MSHNMLSGMDLLTRLRGTLLPEKEAKSSSQFSCKGEDTIIFCWYSFNDTYRMTNPLTSFFVKNLVYSFECICNMVLNIKGMKWLTCEGMISVVKQTRNSVLRCSVKRVIKKGEASKFPYTDCSKYYGQRRTRLRKLTTVGVCGKY